MGIRTTYTPGTFSWVDLETNDIGSARAFYGGLLGWRDDDGVARIDDDAVAGLAESSAPDPRWTSYVNVDDVGATLARAEALGATVVDGRVALLRDPQGALLGLRHGGADRVNDPGSLCMNELVAPDLGAARAFYEQLFGWTTADMDFGSLGSGAFVMNGGRVNGSMLQAPNGDPAHWRACFTVASMAAALERVSALGGEVVGGPGEIGDGSHAVVRDAQGVVIALFAGDTDD
jgi:predicted enzyme related to lactoylglutathione lyase